MGCQLRPPDNFNYDVGVCCSNCFFFVVFFFFKRVVCFNGSYSHMITAQLQLGKAFNNRHYFTPHLAISLLLEFSGHIHSQIA